MVRLGMARQAKNRQLEVDAAEIRIRAERRVGELMAMQRETVGLAKPPGINQYVDRVAPKPEAPNPNGDRYEIWDSAVPGFGESWR